MAIITENIKEIADTMILLQKLDDQEYTEQEKLSQEQIDEIKINLKKDLEKYKDQVAGYVEYKLKERQEHKMLASGIDAEIKELKARKETEENKMKRIENWIDYLCKFAGIKDLKTPVAVIQYKDGNNMKVTDDGIALLPENLKGFTLGKIEPEMKEKIIEAGIEVIDVPGNLNDIKKRYKDISSKREEAEKTYTQYLNMGSMTQSEYDEQMKKISEEKSLYAGKIFIDTTPSLSIK